LENQREPWGMIPWIHSRKELELSNCLKVSNTKILEYYILIRFIFIDSKFNYTADQRKPAVPKKDEKPILGLVSDKNYIVANAVENILAGIIFLI
jgi:hypothetical protein